MRTIFEGYGWAVTNITTPLYKSFILSGGVANIPYFGPDYGRTASGCSIANSNAYISTNVDPGSDFIRFGLAVKRTKAAYVTDGFSYNKFITMTSGATSQLSLSWSPTGALQLRRGAYNGTVLATTSVTYPVGDYTYLTVDIVFDSTAGTVNIYDGEDTNILTYTGDTDPAVSDSVDNITFANGHSSFNAPYITDHYFSDDSVAGRLGEIVVKWYPPTSDGTNQDFDLSTGVDGYALVDEVPLAENDYVTGDTLAERFGVKFTVADEGRTIHAVQPTAWIRNTDVGMRSVAVSAISNVTETAGADQTINSTGKVYREPFHVDPNGDIEWTAAAITAAEFVVGVAV